MWGNITYCVKSNLPQLYKIKPCSLHLQKCMPHLWRCHSSSKESQCNTIILTGLGWTLHRPVADSSTTILANFTQADNCLQQAVDFGNLMIQFTSIMMQCWYLISKSWISGINKQLKCMATTQCLSLKEHPPLLLSNYLMGKHPLDLLGKQLQKDQILHSSGTWRHQWLPAKALWRESSWCQ